MIPRPDVIVIGAGFAGLSAAVALADRGARVLVLEARPGLGGRATAFVDRETGELVDNGQHVLIGCYDETFRFLRTLDTESLVQLESRLDIEFVDREGARSRLRTPHLPAPWNLVVGLMRWPALSWSDRIAALRLGRVLARSASQRGGSEDRPHAFVSSGGQEREHLTVDDWLAAHGQTPRLREMLWEPLAVAALNQPTREASAASFSAVVGRMFSGPARNAAIGLPCVPLDALYARPAAERIERRGGRVRTNTVARVVCEGSRVSHVDVRGERLEAGRVICAVPWHALERTISPVPAAMAEIVRRASSMASSPIVTVNLWLDRPVTSVPFVGLPGRTFQWVFDKRQAFGEQASHLSLVSSGAEAVVSESNPALTERAVNEVREALPAAVSACVVRATVVREKRATFSLAPGQPRRPAAETPVEGLILAGDWIDTGLPATIESAVVSGHRAARLVNSQASDQRPTADDEQRRANS